MDNESQDPAVHSHVEDPLIDDIYRKYVHMVLYARMGSGTWTNSDRLSSFTVYLGDPVVININDEPHGWSVARTRRSLRPGEQLEFEDLTSDQVALPPRQPPFFSAVETPNGWRAESDLSTPHPASDELLATGAEFLAVSEEALRTGALRAFVENAFHATESFVKVELLAYPMIAAELEGSRKHPHVQSVYDLWLRLGNTDSRFPALLRDLNELRAAATYVNEPFVLQEQAATTMLQTLRELAAHAESIGKSTKGRTINVISTRPIAAGELVSTADITIRPTGKRRNSQR
jgi:hypothetical protein